MKPILTAFCFTDIHNQQSMLDYPTTLRGSLLRAAERSVAEFGMADLAIVGGDNLSDYPYWNRSCALPRKNFLDIKAKLHACVSATARGGRVLYVAGNNDMILGDIGTAENPPYNTTDFYDLMDAALGELPEGECLRLTAEEKPGERYLGAFHYTVNGIDFIGINIDPNTAFNSHEGYYSEETLAWVEKKLGELDPTGRKPIFLVGHLSCIYYYNDGELAETMINGDPANLYRILSTHRNAFYLYGHVHGERCVLRDHSSGAVLHLRADGTPLGANLGERDSRGKDYAFSLVHMGGLRPFGKQYFEGDGLTGYGGREEKQHHPGTGTPTLAQYLVFEVFSDRVEFCIRNVGSHPGYTPADRPATYTVYFEE